MSTWQEKLGKIVRDLRSQFFYDGLTREDYKSVFRDIHEANRKNLASYTVLMSIIFGILFIVCFFVTPIKPNRPYYGIAFLFIAALSVVLFTGAKKHWVVTCVINYIFCTLILTFTIIIGTVTAPTLLATSFCVALVILPFITYDIPFRSMIYRAVMCVVFTVVDVHIKDSTFASRDIVNLVCYFFIGTFASGVSQKTRAEMFYLKNNMTESIDRQTQTIKDLSLQSITAMAAAVDAKDRYTNGHSQRVAKYSMMLSEIMGKDPDEQNRIYYIALLHDVGKIGVPDTIINKTSPLTEEEYEIVKTHPQKGYDILKGITAIPGVAIGAKYHHERYDGKGYPEGLKGHEIPETARIIAVADAYDAMTSNRSYRRIMPQEKVYEEIKNGIGAQFDPVIAGFMLEIMRRDKDYELHG